MVHRVAGRLLGRVRIADATEVMREALAIRVPAGSNGRGSRLLLPRTISGPADVDVGDVVIPGGVELRGKIVDRLTGQGMPGARVVAIRRGIGSERLTVTGASTASDGSFRIHGLPPGDVVTGINLAGVPLSGMPGSNRFDVGRALLGAYDGPGITLTVKGADGVEEDVPLEW